MITWAITTLLRINLPLIKTVWLGDISLSPTGETLLVIALEKKITLQSLRLMGLKFLRSTTSGNFLNQPLNHNIFKRKFTRECETHISFHGFFGSFESA